MCIFALATARASAIKIAGIIVPDGGEKALSVFQRSHEYLMHSTLRDTWERSFLTPGNQNHKLNSFLQGTASITHITFAPLH